MRQQRCLLLVCGAVALLMVVGASATVKGAEKEYGHHYGVRQALITTLITPDERSQQQLCSNNS